MKKSIFITTAIAVLASALFFVSCGAQIDKELYDQTIGKKSETVPPGDVKNLSAAEYSRAVTLQWENPTDKDFYGLTISSIPAAGGLEQPVSFINDNSTEIPNSFNVTNLPGNISYTFKIVTFDDNMNYSKGASVTAKPAGDNSTSTGNFLGSGDVFGYKMNKSAFDFGYCSEPTTKTIEIIAQDEINSSATILSDIDRMGDGSFEIVKLEPKGIVKIGNKLSITVKYTPATSPCWDEIDILVGGNEKSKLRLLGSNFKQPKNISMYDGEKEEEYGLKLWLRADLISASDIEGEADAMRVKKIPDYSGREYHAYCTDTSYLVAPSYIEKDQDFNYMPSVDFTGDSAKKSQLLSMGTGSDPISNSDRGHTTFIVLTKPKESVVQAIMSANYGQSFPTLISHSRCIDEKEGFSTTNTYGWAVKGYGLKDYRYPCTSDSTTDPDNMWLTNAKLPNTAHSLCMRYDQLQLQNAVYDESTKKNNFNGNIRMQMNGSERLLSWIYSNSTLQALRYEYPSSTTTATCYGAYGKPISDGKGHRYGTLSGIESITSTIISNVVNNTASKYLDTYKHKFYHWYSDNDSRLTDFPDEHYTLASGEVLGRTYPEDRKWDYAYSLTPYEYVNEKGEYTCPKTKSLASTDSGYTSAGYYTNWVSPKSYHNGTIYNLILGLDNNIGTISTSKISEVIMFDYPLSDEEIDIVNNYIYYRYKIGTAK